MKIEECVIERRDGPTFCGLLFYRNRHLQHLCWSVDHSDPTTVVVVLYGTSAQSATLHAHYTTFADRIVDQVLSLR